VWRPGAKDESSQLFADSGHRRKTPVQRLGRPLPALDTDTGKVLFQTRLSSQVIGGAVTYSVNGRQYMDVFALPQ
jgi:hypothetical protein